MNFVYHSVVIGMITWLGEALNSVFKLLVDQLFNHHIFIFVSFFSLKTHTELYK